MVKYTYTIFDSDPNEGDTAWPDRRNIAIGAEDDEMAVARVYAILENEAALLSEADGYSNGDTLHAYVWNHNGYLVGHPTATVSIK